MPVLYILAGPNGTGKTTYYFTALEKGYINKDLPFLNVDLIAYKELGGYSNENFAKADVIFRDRIKDIISNQQDFLIESNLSKDADYVWLENMSKTGYDIVLFFMSTEDINVNINRVKRRVIEGGHDIPVEIIIHRYKMAHTYLRGKLHLFKEIYLIDNTGEEAVEVAQITNDILAETVVPLPHWAENLLYIFKRRRK